MSGDAHRHGDRLDGQRSQTHPRDHHRRGDDLADPDVFHPPSAIRYLQIGGRRLSEEQAQREFTVATVVFVLWITFLMIGVAVLLRVLSPGHPLEYVIFDVMSAQSNVSLDSGITGPTMPDTATVMLIVNMWVGRLESIPVAVLLGTVFRRFDLYR